MSEYGAVVKGSLKLKTDSKIQKKSKKNKNSRRERHKEEIAADVEVPEGVKQPKEPKITKTAAEVEFEKRKEKRMLETILTKAEKSHKQRIMEFNEHLNSMSEHFDIPKVSWTK